MKSKALRTALILLMASLIFSVASFAQTAAAPASNWQSLEFLFGDWVGQGGGEPGAGSGGHSFRPELDGHIVVRHSHSEYPDPKTGAVLKHDDLMVVYRDTTTSPMSAIYFDGEGHVIHYTVATQPGAAIFESDPSQAGPRYKLSYRLNGKNVDGKFEIAAPGTADYKTYLSWTSTKK